MSAEVAIEDQSSSIILNFLFSDLMASEAQFADSLL
jgi:hypothetical protein